MPRWLPRFHKVCWLWFGNRFRSFISLFSSLHSHIFCPVGLFHYAFRSIFSTSSNKHSKTSLCNLTKWYCRLQSNFIYVIKQTLWFKASQEQNPWCILTQWQDENGYFVITSRPGLHLYPLSLFLFRSLPCFSFFWISLTFSKSALIQFLVHQVTTLPNINSLNC